MRPNSKLIKTTLIGALGGLLFGFDIAVVSGIIESITRFFGLSVETMSVHSQGFTMAVGTIGTVLGCFVGGVIGQRLGSRAALRYAAGFYILAVLGCALALNWPMLLGARFLAGMAIGTASVLGPVYITELAPAMWRGRLVGAFQINIVVGILLGYTSNCLIGLAHLGELEWRAMVAVALVPAIVFFALLFRIPLSPRWSASRHQTAEALETLGQMGDPDPKAELADIQAALSSEHATKHEPVFQWKYRFPLFLAITIGAFNQLEGINAILYYIKHIFAAAGFNQLSGDLQAVGIAFTNLIFTLVGMSVIDRFGRKSLLMVGAAGTTLCLSGVAWIFITNSHQAALLALLVVYIAFFALSQGAVIWVYLGEVFPTSVRSKGQGVGSASHWTLVALIAFFFPVLAGKFGTGTPFVFFAVATALQFLVVTFFYPETKGQTLEQLQRRLVKS